MAVNTVQFKRNLAANADRGPSAAIWADCPWIEGGEDPATLIPFWDDFVMAGNADMTSAFKGSLGQWSAYGSAGALLQDAELEGGVLKMNADGDQESVTLQSRAGSYRITTPTTYALGQKLWFETRVAVSTISSTKMDCFVGLADKLTTSDLTVNTIPISTTDDTLSTQPNLIGFHKKSGTPTDWQFVYQVAGGTAVYPTNLTTLVNSVTGSNIVAQSGQTGFVKLGFLFDPNAYMRQIATASTGQTAGTFARPLVRIFVNGVPAAAFLTSTNVAGATFPSGFMGPTISVMQTATGANSLLPDWIRVAQLPSF